MLKEDGEFPLITFMAAMEQTRRSSVDNTVRDVHHPYDYYWDLSMHVPRFYVEPFGARFHEHSNDLSDAEHRLERLFSPQLEEIVSTDKVLGNLPGESLSYQAAAAISKRFNFN